MSEPGAAPSRSLRLAAGGGGGGMGMHGARQPGRAVARGMVLAALAASCAVLLAGCGSVQTPAVPAEAAASAESAAHASPGAAADAEARILAHRVLRRESDALLLDGSRLRAYGHEITRVLALIRQRYPAMAEISVREERRPATLLLGLEGALRDAVADRWGDEGAPAVPPTGIAAFDALNARLGLRAVQTFPALGSVALRLDERLNVEAAIAVYEAIDGVAYAEPDVRLGGGSDIEATRARGTWHVVFRKAWGDCPAGCIDDELSFFTVEEGGWVERVELARALDTAAFGMPLLRRGWR